MIAEQPIKEVYTGLNILLAEMGERIAHHLFISAFTNRSSKALRICSYVLISKASKVNKCCRGFGPKWSVIAQLL